MGLILRKERGVSLNQRFMAMHVLLLFLVFASQVWAFGFGYAVPLKSWFMVWTSYHVMYFVASLVSVFILWTIDGKQKEIIYEEVSAAPGISQRSTITKSNASFSHTEYNQSSNQSFNYFIENIAE